MNGKPERRLQDLLLLQAHAEGEQQARNQPRQIPRELDAAAVHEEIHDGQVEVLAASRGQGLRARYGHVHAVSLAPKNHGEGSPAGDVAVDEEQASHRRE
jgi:hypothetical protein